MIMILLSLVEYLIRVHFFSFSYVGVRNGRIYNLQYPLFSALASPGCRSMPRIGLLFYIP